jgi:hypothetical protein
MIDSGPQSSVIARSPKGDEAIQKATYCPGLLRFAGNDGQVGQREPIIRKPYY